MKHYHKVILMIFLMSKKKMIRNDRILVVKKAITRKCIYL